MCSFSRNFAKFSERQTLWSLCSVVFLTFALKLSIQTSLSVAPELRVSLSLHEKCPNFYLKISLLLPNLAGNSLNWIDSNRKQLLLLFLGTDIFRSWAVPTWNITSYQRKGQQTWKHCSSGTRLANIILLISASEIPRCRARDGSLLYMIHLDIWFRSLSSRRSSSSYRCPGVDPPLPVAILTSKMSLIPEINTKYLEHIVEYSFYFYQVNPNFRNMRQL